MTAVNARLIERLCDVLHSHWIGARRRDGLTSLRSEHTDEELMVPYAQLSQRAREELHRRDARRVLFTLGDLGLTVGPFRTWR